MIACCTCGKAVKQRSSAIGRALRDGKPLYCDRTCAGIARRRQEPIALEELKARKKAYDAERRVRKHDELCAKKRAHYYANRDRILAEHAAYRAEHMARHVEYCRRPEYKAWKAKYDRQHLARRKFGEFAEAALLLRDIETEIDKRASKYDIYMQNGTINKAQTRRRSL